MVDCGLCIRIDSCETHKHMKAIASCPPFELGAAKGILERLEELAEFCGKYAERSCGYCDHFIPDNDLSDPDYNPDIDGHCGEGGFTEIGNSNIVRTPDDPNYCVAWNLANELEKGINNAS